MVFRVVGKYVPPAGREASCGPLWGRSRFEAVTCMARAAVVHAQQRRAEVSSFTTESRETIELAMRVSRSLSAKMRACPT